MSTVSCRLSDELDWIASETNAILEAEGSINHVSDRARKLSGGDVAVLVPDGGWGKLGPDQLAAHRRLLGRWASWTEQLELLFSEDAPLRRKRIAEDVRRASEWVERSGGRWSIPATAEEARSVFARRIAPLHEALAELATGSPGTIAVPDTNVLLRSPDIAQYGDVLGVSAYTVALVPGVLQELDAHKVNHRNENVRDKARKFSSRIKGWRNQGKLAECVRVQGEVFIQVFAKEPDFTKTLSWLEKDVVDDRIIATALEIQRRRPADRVVILSGDVAMLAKADTASIPTADTPEPDDP